ncbi:MAG: type II secretion system secretin GspD [Thermodesulfobacteriota bacterium]
MAILICLVFCVFIRTSPVTAQSSEQQQDSSGQPAGIEENAEEDDDQRVSIDFNEVDINVFIKFISELTGRNFIVDPRVKGKITVVSPSEITAEEAYRVFESVLDVHGYATVESGTVTKIIPAPTARTKSIETKLKRQADEEEDRIVTQVIPLEYADPDEIKKIFSPLVSKSAVIISYPPTGTLIVTDVYSNIRRLMSIIDTLDVEGTGREISFIPVEHADAEEMVGIIESLFNDDQGGDRRPGSEIIAVAENRTNTLVVQSSEPEAERIKQLVKMLDREMPKGKEKVHVYYLENAKAEELVDVIQELPSEGSDDSGKTEAPLVSESVNVSADEATNSLIIRADKDDYEVLASVIEKLDIPRAMVYIEVLIMEVSKDKSFRLGAEWIVGGEASHDGREGVYGGGFSGGAMGGDSGYDFTVPEAGAQGGAPLPPGYSMGVLGENIQVGDIRFPTIRALIQAYQKDRDAQILSTPQILTTDNKSAQIRVGRNIPYLTRAASGETEYSNYEYKDVGILLEITPQINKDGKIRLELLQEVTKLEDTTADFQPTTLKRTVETTVEVENKNTVVIGGLIDESLSNREFSVPCLGSIPGLGWLFKSMASSDEETNLFVFLTPRVMSEPEEASDFYEEKKGDMQIVPEESIKLYGRPGTDEEESEK